MLHSIQQLELFEEPETYHDVGQHGFFALLVRFRNPDSPTPPTVPLAGLEQQQDAGKTQPYITRQRSYRLSQMPRVLAALDPTRDTWISQAEFTQPNRRVVNLLRVGLLFVDLDIYKSEYGFVGYSPERQLRLLLQYCGDKGIPEPSLVVYSGRGLQAKWLLDKPLPRAALPRWNACQRYLVDKLSELGADAAAKDASRVLRLVRTVNTKSGQIVRLVHVTEDENGDPARYPFEYLAEHLLPVSRQEIEEQRRKRAQKRSERLKIIEGGKKGHRHLLHGFSGRQLAWDRLEDLRRLAEIRGGVRQGERMLHLFWRLNFLLLSGATSSSQMYHEAVALARELDPSWGYGSDELSTLYQKARAHEAGETIEFNGKRYPPLYTPKNDTLIQIFRITDEEQRQLKTIVSRDIAAERHREREKARRRAAGAKPRASEEIRATARLMAAKGMSTRQIARELGVGKSTIANWLSSNK